MMKKLVEKLFDAERKRIKEEFDALYEELFVTGNVALDPKNQIHIAFGKLLNGEKNEVQY